MSDEKTQVDREGDPIVHDYARKVTMLERRRDYLRSKIERRRGSDSAIEFDKHEEAALSDALRVMAHHEARMRNKRAVQRG